MFYNLRRRLLPLLYKLYTTKWYRKYHKLRHQLFGAEISAKTAKALFMSAKHSCKHYRPQLFSSMALIIPCFGHEKYLHKMFESILLQSRKPDRVVFVDDCSPDGSSVLLEEFLDEASGCGITCTVLKNDSNSGQAFSINRAINTVDTDLVMILNDDDYLFHDIIEVQFDLFAKYPEVCLIGASAVHVDSDEHIMAVPQTIAGYRQSDELMLSEYCTDGVKNYRNFNDINMSHTGCCFWRQAWQDVGGYQAVGKKRVVPFSDRDFQLRVNALYKIGICHDAPFSFWRTNSSVDRWLNS